MASPLCGQIGSVGAFDFLNLTQSARTTALGAANITISDTDIAQGFVNPALLDDTMRHHLSVNHNFHLADISYGFLAYGLYWDRAEITVMAGFNYVDYGAFRRADQFGNLNGTFSGNENAFTIGLSRLIDTRLKAGINLKYVLSTYDAFQSSGIGFDIGFHYTNPDGSSSWALLLKNSGWQISSYNDLNEDFPFDLQLGFSKRLKHLPFQFMITAHHLQRWNLRTTTASSNDPIVIGSEPQDESGFSKGVDNFFRHLIFGGEFYIGKNEVFNLRFGYNHLRNKELSVSGFRSLSGFSFGLGIRIKKIKFDYGLGRYHLGGGMNHLSLTLNMNSVFDKL